MVPDSGTPAPLTGQLKSPVAHEDGVPHAATRFRAITPSRRWLVISLVLGMLSWSGYAAWCWYRARSFSNECIAAREAKDWHTEREIAREWTEWQPTSGTAWLHAAEAAQGLGDLPEMAKCLGEVPASDPRAIVAYAEKANLEWTGLNRPEDGLATCEKIIELDSRVMEAHARVISFYAINLQRTKMLEAIRRAIDAGSEPRESYVYLILADNLTLTNGRELNSRWLASDPDSERFKVGLAVHTAMAALQTGDSSEGAQARLHQEALRQLEWFLEELPHDPVLLAYLLDRAVEAGDIERVETLLQDVDANSADDHMIWVYRGWYHSVNGEYDAAESSFERALQLHPLSPRAYTEYATFLRKSDPARVEEIQRRATIGSELRSQLLQIPNAAAVTSEQLQAIADYAADCGDEQVSEALQKRLPPRRIETEVLP